MMALSAKTLSVPLGPVHVHACSSRMSGHLSAPRPLVARHVTKAIDMTSSSIGIDPLRHAGDGLEALITTDAIKELESVLDNGASVAALRRFNDLLAALPAESWEEKLEPVMNELAYNLESFNPAFAAVVLRVQCTIGRTDYCKRGAP